MTRHRIACSINGRVVTAWEGVTVRDLFAPENRDAVDDVVAGRARIVDSVGEPVEFDRVVTDGAAFMVVPVPHPGYKPI